MFKVLLELQVLKAFKDSLVQPVQPALRVFKVLLVTQGQLGHKASKELSVHKGSKG